MVETARKISLLGLVIFSSVIAPGLRGFHPQVMGVLLCYGFILIFVGWYMKDPSYPPVSFGAWLVTGNNIPYEDMSTRQLLFERQYLLFKYEQKTSWLHPIRKTFDFTIFDKYTSDEIEQALENCTNELYSREDYLYTSEDLQIQNKKV